MVPIIPSSGSHHIGEVCIRVNYHGELAHCSAHVDWARTHDPTSHESKTRLLFWGPPALCRYGPKPRCDRVQLAILVHGPPIAKNEVNGALDVAVLEVVAASVVIESVLHT